MQRIFSAILLVLIGAFVSQAHAGWGTGNFLMGPSGSCFVDTYYYNAFWFCGKQSEDCHDKSTGRNTPVKWMNHGDVLTKALLQAGESDIDDETLYDKYICCNGTTEKQGVFKENKNYTAAKEVNGGTCQQEYNACGEMVGTICTEPDEDGCPVGKSRVQINGLYSCVDPCKPGEGFENENSDQCVKCPTEKSQGVNDSGVCEHCSSGKAFSTKTNECVSLDSTNFSTFSKSAIQRCWKCPSDSSVLTRCFNDWQGNGESNEKISDKKACGISD